MKGWAFSVLAVVAFVCVLWVSDEAQATGNCSLPVANRCHGMSMVGTTTGGIGSGRCFFFTTLSSAPACSTGGIGTTANQAYEVDAGGCQTWYYWNVANGATPPATPNKVYLRAYFDVLGTVYSTFVAPPTAAPTSGTSYSFCATSTGAAGGTARAGTWYFEIRAVKDDGPGGVGNYDILSSGVGSQDTSFDAGGLRAKTLVSSIARNAYPAGSTFAYGPAGDETITITATFTQPGGDNNLETSHTSILDASTLLVGQVAATQDIDATTTQAQSYTADSTFPAANSPYVPGWTIAGDAALFGEKWTVLATTGHGAGLTRVSDTYIYDGSFNIDPRIVFDSDGAGTFASADDLWVVKLGSSSGPVTSVFNKGETVYAESYVFNARSEKLTRPMTGIREDATPTGCATGTQTPTGAGLYSGASALTTGVVCATTADATGAPRFFRFTNTDQDHRSNQVFAVSSLYYVDSHIQVASTLVPDDYPTEDAGEYFAYTVQGDGMGGDMSDTVRQWCHVDGVRHEPNIDTSGSAVTRTIKDPTTTTRLTGTTDTGSDGWTPTAQTLLASSPLGTWTALCSVSFNGNTGTDTESFITQVPAGGGGDTFQADPLKAFAVYNPSSDKVRVAISAAFLDGTARTGAAADIYVDAWNEALSQVVTAANPTELAGTAYGVYTYDFTPATDGIFTVRVRTVDPDTMEPITVGNDLLVSQPATFSFNGTTDNATLASLLEQLDNHTEGDWWTMDFDGIPATDFVMLGLWIVAAIWCMRRAKLFAAIAATVGIACVLIPGPEWIGWVGVLFFVLALWLEAVARDRLPYHWFKGSRSVE